MPEMQSTNTTAQATEPVDADGATAELHNGQPPESQPPLIVLFDGTCGLCDKAVSFILQRDTAKRFRFAPQQSQVARDLMTSHGLDPESTDSVVVIDGDRAYTRSAAVVRILHELPDPLPLAGLLIFVPPSLRDGAYDFIARHRKQWFKSQDCRVPTEQERERFLA